MERKEEKKKRRKEEKRKKKEKGSQLCKSSVDTCLLETPKRSKRKEKRDYVYVVSLDAFLEHFDGIVQRTESLIALCFASAAQRQANEKNACTQHSKINEECEMLHTAQAGQRRV